jgi:hypothetical protein
LEVPLDRCSCGHAEDTDAFFVAFPADAHRLVAQVYFRHVQAGDFADAEAGGVKELEEGAVAEAGGPGAVGGGEEAVDILGGEDMGQAARRFGSGDAEEGVGFEDALGAEPAVEGADGADFAPDAGVGGALAEEEGEVAAQVEAAGAQRFDLPACEGEEEVLQVAAVVAQGVGGEVAGLAALYEVAGEDGGCGRREVICTPA